jgi:hypothetical protein
MLPGNVGDDTPERTAFHEAGHAVYLRGVGGSLSAIAIAQNLQTKTWEGGIGWTAPPGVHEQIRIHFAGPLAEARFVANVYDYQQNWRLDAVASQPGLTNWPSPALNKDVRFLSGALNKTLGLHRGMFSDDWDAAFAHAAALGLTVPQRDALLDQVISHINQNDVWEAIIEIAKRLLDVRPQIRYELDSAQTNQLIDNTLNGAL